MKVLISGGVGYIGSTIASALLDGGHTPVLLDSLVTGRKEFTKDRIFYEADIADRAMVRTIFSDHPDIEATIHCAALIVVPESVAKPYEYYKENVVKSMEFFKLLAELGQKRVVFSSSAAVYDVVPGFMVTEESPLRPLSPYSRTKYMMEMVLKDFCSAYGLNAIALRYFNPIRDYIHVWDLAQAHIRAVERFDSVIEQGREEDAPYTVINLGTGQGVTVKEFVVAFEDVYGQKLPVSLQPPRPGDVAGSYANADKAARLLGWKAELPIEQGIADALKWGKVRDTIIHY